MAPLVLLAGRSSRHPAGSQATTRGRNNLHGDLVGTDTVGVAGAITVTAGPGAAAVVGVPPCIGTGRKRRRALRSRRWVSESEHLGRHGALVVTASPLSDRKLPVLPPERPKIPIRSPTTKYRARARRRCRTRELALSQKRLRCAPTSCVGPSAWWSPLASHPPPVELGLLRPAAGIPHRASIRPESRSHQGVKRPASLRIAIDCSTILKESMHRKCKCYTLRRHERNPACRTIRTTDRKAAISF